MDVTGSQCKSKMAGLKNTYKSVKDHNSKSGNNTRTWQYFDVNIQSFTCFFLKCIYYFKMYFIVCTYFIAANI